MLSKIHDAFNLLSKLTFKKSLNALKIFASYQYSKFFKKLIHKGLPISIAIEPTTSCNLRCPECPSGLRAFTRPTGVLQENLFKKVIDELQDTLLYLTFYFQGEPYLHPRFTELVKYATEKGIYTSTSTNAHFLNEENAKKTILSGLDRLIISIDGTTQASYEAYRIGGQLSKVIEGTKNMVRWKKKLGAKTPYIIFQFLVVRPNEHQISEVKQLGRELGVDEVKLKTAQIYDYENGSPLIPTLPQYARYQQTKDGKYVIKNGMANSCWRMWHSCVITWNGAVVPCCFDKDAHYQLGQVESLSFKTVWKSAEYQNFRKLLLKSRSKIEICKNCTEGTKVWA